MTARVALGVRIAAALHGDVVLVARPRGVVHLHAGAVSRSGGSVPAGSRPLCGVRSRRLRVLGADLGTAARLSGAGRRFCRTCTTLLPARVGGDVSLVSRDDWIAAYGGVLTVADLQLAGRWAVTVDETYQVETLLMRLHGPKPATQKAAAALGSVALLDAYETAAKRRRHLAAAAMTDEQRAEAASLQEAARFTTRLNRQARRREIALSRVLERQASGSYLLPHERELLNSA